MLPEPRGRHHVLRFHPSGPSVLPSRLVATRGGVDLVLLGVGTAAVELDAPVEEDPLGEVSLRSRERSRAPPSSSGWWLTVSRPSSAVVERLRAAFIACRRVRHGRGEAGRATRRRGQERQHQRERQPTSPRPRHYSPRSRHIRVQLGAPRGYSWGSPRHVEVVTGKSVHVFHRSTRTTATPGPCECGWTSYRTISSPKLRSPRWTATAAAESGNPYVR